MGAFAHRAKKHVGMQQPRFIRRGAVYLKIETVELLPHLCAALFANLPQILARRCNARNNRRRIRLIERENVRKRGRIDLAILGSRRLQSFQKPPPSPRPGLGRLIEAQLQIDVDQARGVFGALQVAAHPVETVGDARQHGRLPLSRHARNTQVSLLPPPCDEFTTSEPRRNATRVRPPGTSVTFSP